MTADASLPVMELSGFGGYRRATQSFARPERIDDLRRVLADGAKHTLIARGKGMSYGDAALNGSGAVISMERLDRFLSFDPASGILQAEAGVLIIDVMRLAVPRGFMLAAVPGYSAITLGGCAAFDVHSKNHWRKGGFGEWIISMRLMSPTGETVNCSRSERPELFFATIGGLGMTGIILDMTIQLDSLASSFVESTSQPFGDLPDLFDKFEACLPKSDYAVAWLDLLNFDKPRGKLFTTIAGAATSVDYRREDWNDSRTLPLGLISPVYNRPSNRIFNVAFSAKHHLFPNGKIALRPFLFPWDGMPNWNRLYGRRGFVEYQCCIPLATARDGIGSLLDQVRKARSEFPVYFAAVKRMKQGTGMLSFPLDGYSLLLDFPISDGLWPFLDQLDAAVVKHGGRVYLAKDGRLSGAAFAKMYPERDKWLEVSAVIDPQNRFASDMSRRLGISGKVQ